MNSSGPSEASCLEFGSAKIRRSVANAIPPTPAALQQLGWGDVESRRGPSKWDWREIPRWDGLAILPQAVKFDASDPNRLWQIRFLDLQRHKSVSKESSLSKPERW
jgi:hypothetical protein